MRALVIEGGGMRAAYANGVLAAFEDAGDYDFDAVYGTSAGGALAAWFAAKQARFAYGTWPYVNDRRIMSYRRWFLQRGPLLDHDALFRIVYAHEHKLDLAAVHKAPFPVVVSVTEVKSGQTKYVDVRGTDVLPWLRATGRLPLATGPAVRIDGVDYLDGGVTDPIPVAHAISEGHDEIVCILNTRKGPRGAEPNWLGDVVARRYPHLAEHVRRHHLTKDAAIRLAEDPPDSVNVRIIRPRQDFGVGRLSRDKERLDRAMRGGQLDGEAYLAERRAAAQPRS